MVLARQKVVLLWTCFGGGVDDLVKNQTWVREGNEDGDLTCEQLCGTI